VNRAAALNARTPILSLRTRATNNNVTLSLAVDKINLLSIAEPATKNLKILQCGSCRTCRAKATRK